MARMVKISVFAKLAEFTSPLPVVIFLASQALRACDRGSRASREDHAYGASRLCEQRIERKNNDCFAVYDSTSVSETCQTTEQTKKTAMWSHEQ